MFRRLFIYTFFPLICYLFVLLTFMHSWPWIHFLKSDYMLFQLYLIWWWYHPFLCITFTTRKPVNMTREEKKYPPAVTECSRVHFAIVLCFFSVEMTTNLKGREVSASNLLTCTFSQIIDYRTEQRRLCCNTGRVTSFSMKDTIPRQLYSALTVIC